MFHSHCFSGLCTVSSLHSETKWTFAPLSVSYVRPVTVSRPTCERSEVRGRKVSGEKREESLVAAAEAEERDVTVTDQCLKEEEQKY